MNFLSSLFKAVGEIFGWARSRSEANNAAPIQENKAAQLEADAKAKTANAIKNHDIDEIRKEQAE